MKIYTDTPEGVTVVKNTFIDQYMPQANGEFVKVYLYLLRCANTGRELSLSSIADVLEHTENDIRKRLTAMGKDAWYFRTFDEIENFLLENCIPGDLLITMGAGDVVKIGENLLGM